MLFLHIPILNYNARRICIDKHSFPIHGTHTKNKLHWDIAYCYITVTVIILYRDT